MYAGHSLPSHSLEDCQAQSLIGICDVDQVMRDTLPFLMRWLGCANIHAAVEKARICRDNLGVQRLGQPQGHVGLPNCSRTHDNHQRIREVTPLHFETTQFQDQDQ